MASPAALSQEQPVLVNDDNHDTDSPSKQHSDIEKSDTPPAPGPPAGLSPPPDGGLNAWLQVTAGFVLFFNTWGMLTAFGVFQNYYESGDLFVETSSNISWIGSLQCFLLQLTGIVAGPIYDRGYLRHLMIAGSFLVVFGLMMLSLCKEFWQALLAQGFCIGIGGGLLFVPTVSLLPTYFTTRLGLAVGIASSGSSLGAVIYPIVLSRLIPQIGFPWAVRVIGFIALATFIIPLLVMKMRVHPPKPRAIVDWEAFRDVPFMTFTLGVVIVFIANTVLLFYIAYYPQEQGYTNPELASYMPAILNAASVLGRILPNALSDRIGVFNTIAPFTVAYGVVIFCLIAVHTKAGMIVEALVTGFFSGVVIAMPPVCFRMLTENKSMIGTRIGQGFAISGFGLLIGGPSTGAILGTEKPLQWTETWVYGGVTACAAGLIFFVVRFMKSGFGLKIKI